ncbi:hypothetical protein DM01DRAFT_1339501 [Hesseltinella vesiculosa]|uniref:Hamartin-domain-containing protein n=1 Tax=Hesseltinella vesiculosa TaxID=101127 RepID=A0A1X2G6S5_9FUNG|nr:hypothetical protein DM01DRAFT_1339501 [Hesseltinella vesiculosa]
MVTLKDILKSASVSIRNATAEADGQTTLDVIDTYLDEHAQKLYATVHAGSGAVGPTTAAANATQSTTATSEDQETRAAIDKLSTELFYLYNTTILVSPIAATVVSCSPEARILHSKQLLLLKFLHALVPLLGPQRLFESSWWIEAIHPLLTTATFTDAIKNEARAIVTDSLVLELQAQTQPTCASRIVHYYLESAKKYQEREEQHIDAVLENNLFNVQEDLRMQHQALLAMEQDEWSKNLLIILMSVGAAEAKAFFCLLDHAFQSSVHRLQIVYLISEFMLRKRTHAHEILDTPLFESMLKSLMYDNSTTLIAISVTNMIMLLPRICAMLPPFLPQLFYIFARAISWDQLRDMRKRQTLSSAPGLKIDPTWDCADFTFSKLTAPPSNPQTGPFFTALYGLYPCNFLKFLHKPYAYFESVSFVVPEEFDEETFRTRVMTQVSRHMLHPNIVSMTAEDELTDRSRWMKMEPPDVIALVMSLDLTNAASRSAFSSSPQSHAPNSMDLLDTTIWSATKEYREQQHQLVKDLPAATPLAATLPPRHQHISTIDTSTPLDLAKRPSSGANSPLLAIKQQQPMMTNIVQLHKALKSGSEIFTGDDIWDATLQHVTSPSVSACASPKIKEPPNQSFQGALQSTGNEDARDPAIADSTSTMSSETKLLIAGLKREVLLLRNELTFELFLKQQHLQHIGRLHREHVMDSTVEAERQQLYNANRMLNSQLKQTTEALERLRAESAMAKQKHIKWEDDQSGKLRGFRDARREWQAHMEVAKKDLDDYRLLIDDQRSELEQARKMIFDLQNQVTTLQPMVEMASNYEQRIRQLTQQMLLWEEDTAHLKEQKKYIKGLLSEWWSMEGLVASIQAENQSLEEDIRHKSARLDQLQRQAESTLADKPDHTPDPALPAQEPTSRQKELDEMKLTMRALKEELATSEMEKLRYQAELERQKYAAQSSSETTSQPC